MITVTGPSYLDVLMRVPHLAAEGEKVRGHVVRESPGGGAMNTAAWLAAEGAQVRLVTPRADLVSQGAGKLSATDRRRARRRCLNTLCS